MQSEHNLGFTDIAQYHCLRWAELPDLALYMDQVLTILEKQLCLIACGPEDKNLTSTMINNYVKHKVIPAPIKKKYGKSAILKGMNLEEGATAKERNSQIGGHKA